ncbi:MAG: 50S ribosomal protein L18Ae [Candidatus Diapherotrites archaeon]|nr:50S ribosomal protein L18a [Candidatus Micrarchaeota archaeon]MBU1939875.1 50S ribosomal protein L18a [Candidatus Micrarchaeota archaeon]
MDDGKGEKGGEGMKKFEVRGTYLEKGIYKKFTKSISAINEGAAREYAFSSIGSNHGANRRQVKIAEVKESQEAE